MMSRLNILNNFVVMVKDLAVWLWTTDKPVYSSHNWKHCLHMAEVRGALGWFPECVVRNWCAIKHL